MNIKKIFTHNWKVKLISLVIALGFWTYVSSIGVQIDELPGGVPLEIKNLKSGYVAITDIERVDIKLIAENNIWKKIKSEDINASIDLAGYEPGTYELDISVQIDVPNVQISDINPNKVRVLIEPEISKTIPVNVKIEGDAADGLIPGTPEVIPDQVEIIGAQSVLDNILEATAVVKINGESEDISRVVELVAFNADNEKIKNIRFNPINVTVNIPIIRADTSKTVGIKVITQGQPLEGYWVSSVSTIPNSVVITGTSQSLLKTNYIETYPIDISDISENNTYKTNLNIPQGISLIDDIGDITVNLKLSGTQSSKQINAQMNFINLNDDLKITTIIPSFVSVTISAEDEILNKINSSDIVLNLDLNGYQAGEYNANILKDMFTIPEETTILSYSPSAIKIITSNK